MIRDIRRAWRFVAKAPITSGLQILTFAVAVALATVGLALIDENFWHPLDLRDGGALVTVYGRRAAAPNYQVLSQPDFIQVQDRWHEAADIAAFTRVFQTFAGDNGTGDRGTLRAQGELVSSDYFSILGTPPFMGRTIDAGAERRAALVVVAFDFWRDTLASDPSVIGKVIHLNRKPYTVIGVMPNGFHGPAYPSQFWLPLDAAATVFGRDLLARAEIPMLQTIAAPKPGHGAQTLQARLQGLDTFAAKQGWEMSVLPAVYLKVWPGHRAVVMRFVTIVIALAVSVLIVACGNLAGLMLARSRERQMEIALIQALGASRTQVLRRVLAESLLIASVGAVTGWALAVLVAGRFEHLAIPAPVRLTLTPNLRFAGIAMLLSAGAWAFVAFLASIRTITTSGQSLVTKSVATIAPRLTTQRALVVVQLAMSCVCLTACGLLLVTAREVEAVDVGFDTRNIVVASVAVGDPIAARAAGESLFERLQTSLRQAPQVEDVAVEWNVALGAGRANSGFTVAGTTELQLSYNVVGTGYFRAMGIPLAAGREFAEHDRRDSEPVAIINQTLAARLGGQPLDRPLSVAGEVKPRRIIGVARDIKYNSLTDNPQPYVYLPAAQVVRSEMTLHVRTTDNRAETLVRTHLARLDPDAVVWNVRTMQRQVGEAKGLTRTLAGVSTGLACIALFLATMGLYGLMITLVQQRRRELCIHAAVGATPRDLWRHVSIDALRLTAGGLVLGMVASVLASGLLASFLYNVRDRDPLVFAAVSGVLLLTSLASWFSPARRAAHSEPLELLKDQR